MRAVNAGGRAGWRVWFFRECAPHLLRKVKAFRVAQNVLLDDLLEVHETRRRRLDELEAENPFREGNCRQKGGCSCVMGTPNASEG